MSKVKLLFVSSLLLLGLGASAQQAPKPEAAKAPMADEHKMAVLPDLQSMKWGPGSEAFPAGMKMVVMSGDPTSTGFVSVRAKFPPGYVVPPHWHPSDEHVTILSGSLYFGMGDKVDTKTATLVKQGGYFVADAQMHHYVVTKTGVVVQIDLTGPLAINYVNPSDDPRNKAPSK